MAHTGQKYKLWFRRDFTLGTLFNNRGYPEAYVLGVVGITSEFWGLDRLNEDMILTNRNKSPGTLRLWEGQMTTSVPHIRATIEVIDTPGIQVKRFELKVFNSSTFRILDLIYDASPFAGEYEAFQSGSAPTVVVKDSLITIDPDNNLVAASAAGWSVYNP